MNRIKFLLKLFFIALIVVYIFSNIDVETVLKQFTYISYFSILLIIIYSVLSDIFNALRWKLISDGKCSFKASLESYYLVSLLNVILPGRAGEISRFFYLQKFYNISSNFSVAVFTLDRGIDVIFLAFAMFLGLQFFLTQISLLWIVVFIVMKIIFFYMVKYKRQKLMRLFSLVPFRFLSVYIKKVIRNIHSILKFYVLVGASIYTLLIWLVNASFFIVFLKYVVNYDLTLMQCFVVYLVSAIGMAVPLAPAGVGTFHAGVVYILTLYGIEKESAVASAVLLHIIQILPSIIGGVFVIMNNKFKIKELDNAN